MYLYTCVSTQIIDEAATIVSRRRIRWANDTPFGDMEEHSRSEKQGNVVASTTSHMQVSTIALPSYGQRDRCVRP